MLGQVLGIERPSPNEVRVSTKMEGNGYLVLSETFYPGWRLEVDGKAAPLLRANYTFRAVALGPGQHQVRFVFQPTLWLVGLGLSILTWLGLAAMLAVGRWQWPKR